MGEQRDEEPQYNIKVGGRRGIRREPKIYLKEVKWRRDS